MGALRFALLAQGKQNYIPSSFNFSNSSFCHSTERFALVLGLRPASRDFDFL